MKNLLETPYFWLSVIFLIFSITIVMTNPKTSDLPPAYSGVVLDTPLEELQRMASNGHRMVYTIFVNHIDEEWLSQQLAAGWELEGVSKNPPTDHKYAVVFSK